MNKTDKKELRKLSRGAGNIFALTESGRKKHMFLTSLNEDGSLNDEALAWKQKRLNQNCTITNVDGTEERFVYEAQLDKNDNWNNIWHKDGIRLLVQKVHIKIYRNSKTPDKSSERTLIKEMWRNHNTQYPE